MRRRILSVLTATAVAAGTLVLSATPAHADPVYPVMNTSEYPPDGVWFRNSPNDADTSRISGYGIYAGDSVQLHCWNTGTNVKRTDGGVNLIWYVATNVTRPTAPGPRANRGWANAHFVNDGTGAGQTAPGVPRCDGNGNPPAPTPPPPSPTYDGSVYFASERNESSLSTVHRSYSAWTNSTRCSSANANNFPSLYNNKYITTAAGWSVGRLGPVYTLEATQDNQTGGRWQEIDYILLIDPGNYTDFFYSGSCDTANSRGPLFTKWLKANTNAKLVILAGKRTGENGHRGIQELYFNYLRNNNGPRTSTDARSRVLVCNYDGASHDAMYADFMNEVNRPPALPLDANDCPATESWAWHP
nr:hypothetical protein [uncultured bacterium]AIA12023.1 hypothetical protein [uncultured bacterium]